MHAPSRPRSTALVPRLARSLGTAAVFAAWLVGMVAYAAWLGGMSAAETLELLGAAAVVLLGLAIFPGSVIFLALYAAYHVGREDGRRDRP